MNAMIKGLLVAALCLCAGTATATPSPQRYWTITQDCSAYSTMQWSDRTMGKALISMWARSGRYYFAITASSSKWNFSRPWVKQGTIQFFPNTKIKLGEVRGLPGTAGTDPTVTVLIEATKETTMLLRTSTRMSVNDGTGQMELPMNRVSDAIDGIAICLSR